MEEVDVIISILEEIKELCETVISSRCVDSEFISELEGLVKAVKRIYVRNQEKATTELLRKVLGKKSMS